MRRRIEALAIEFERLQRRGSALDDGFLRLMSRGHCDYPTCSGTLVIELTEPGRRELRDRLAHAFGESVRFDSEGDEAIDDVIEAHFGDLFAPDVLVQFAEGCRVRAGGAPDSALGRSSIEAVRRAVFGE